MAKKTFSAVEIDTIQPPYVFKCQLYDLTGVPSERQKIMVKGGLLKDDADWLTLGVKEVVNTTVLYGSKVNDDGNSRRDCEGSRKGLVFMEDLPEEEQVVAVVRATVLAYLILENTCYMNSTVQYLHLVPELKSALIK
ncbi:ubiquitin carboxyl-terminal hydrolase [Actinidia rufa]|uniref:ubiquitinyl hydrolase 1 n=1 Tax=Actinidia rufa TaxID=165716 RepID=A0A7J0GLS2_9ERIC|nr:ubiquitin carboxyl-terminal hydrolase [Actinidia rufa]